MNQFSTQVSFCILLGLFIHGIQAHLRHSSSPNFRSDAGLPLADTSPHHLTSPLQAALPPHSAPVPLDTRAVPAGQPAVAAAPLRPSTSPPAVSLLPEPTAEEILEIQRRLGGSVVASIFSDPVDPSALSADERQATPIESEIAVPSLETEPDFNRLKPSNPARLGGKRRDTLLQLVEETLKKMNP